MYPGQRDCAPENSEDTFSEHRRGIEDFLGFVCCRCFGYPICINLEKIFVLKLRYHRLFTAACYGSLLFTGSGGGGFGSVAAYMSEGSEFSFIFGVTVYPDGRKPMLAYTGSFPSPTETV